MSSNLAESPRVSALCDYIEAVGGSVFLPGDDDYTRARSVWNAAVDHRPAVVVRCRNADEVRLAVRAARMRNFPLSVRGGGHDWAGRALRHEGMVIDMSAMRRVRIDPETRTATVQGGATASDTMSAAQPYGLAAVVGNCGAVGMAGLTLGGGYGPLTPRFGLALDNLLSADVVLHDGSIVTADAHNHADLFWALRGGGGNFGVVTSMRIRLHPVREVLAGVILFPWSQASPVLQGFGHIMRTAPDELSVTVVLIPDQNGEPLLLLAPVWTGEHAVGQSAIEPLRSLATPIHENLASISYAELLSLYDSNVVSGRGYAVETRWLSELTPEAIAVIAACGARRTSRLSMIALHHFHGVGTRVATTDTAFGLRSPHFMVEIVASWEDNDRAVHQGWARHLSNQLKPCALPGGYANFLAPDAHEQIASAYGVNAERLRSLKGRFDPAAVFTSAIPLPV